MKTHPATVRPTTTQAMLVCFTTALASVGFGETPTPTLLPLPTMAAAATPTSTLEQVNFGEAPGTVKYIETMWESVGSRFPLKPLTGPDAGATSISYQPYVPPTDPTPTAPTPSPVPGLASWGLPPAIDTTDADMTNWKPNDFSALVVQALFEGDMWIEPNQKRDFAAPIFFMLGASIRSVASLTSGLGKTRTEDWSRDDPAALRESKTVIGLLSQGILLRGGSAYDSFNAVGTIYQGFAANVAEKPCEPGWESYGGDPPLPVHGEGDHGERLYVMKTSDCSLHRFFADTWDLETTLYDYRHWTHFIFGGAESGAAIGKRYSQEWSEPDANGNQILAGPVDARYQQWKEDGILTVD